MSGVKKTKRKDRYRKLRMLKRAFGSIEEIKQELMEGDCARIIHIPDRLFKALSLPHGDH